MKLKLIITTIVLIATINLVASERISILGGWSVVQTPRNGITITCGEKEICCDISASYKYNGEIIDSRSYTLSEVTQGELSDEIGAGILVTLKYQHREYPDLDYQIKIYNDSKDYILLDFKLYAKGDVFATNYAAPINQAGEILPWSKDARALFVPYDNDKWIRYASTPLKDGKVRSYEATAIYDAKSLQGVVIGSVEHDKWKSAIDVTTQSLLCFGGVADELTRDSKEHGAIDGKVVKSPQIYLAVCDDVRDGLEHFALVNTLKTPKLPYCGNMPWGWNSWGALKFDLTYDKAIEVSEFIHDNLQSNSFADPNGSVVMWLDSGWNKFSDEQLAEFVKRCHAANQEAGIYWTPFAEWSKKAERKVKYATEYTNGDIYLLANGAPQMLDNAYAVDPTHPATEKQIKAMAELFKRHGFKYVKLDFMTHGAFEADRWYREDIRTGVEGYNYGMALINKYFDGLYINLSIAPLFPAQYAHSRRIACDAWNKIKDTEYTMNALSYGWWGSLLYHFNDGDHIVLRDVTSGENRARVTSGIMTGIYIIGDDLTLEGDKRTKTKAQTFLTNPRINAMADGATFRPVTGDGERSENHFIKSIDERSCYYVVFNYSKEPIFERVDLEALPIVSSGRYSLTELWSGKEYSSKKSHFGVTIPPMDVYVYKIE